MQAVREIETKRVVYLFDDGDVRPLITTAGLIGPVTATDIGPDTHEVVTVPPPPVPFMGGKLAYDQAWTFADDDYRRETMAVSMRQARRALLAAGLLPAVDAAIAAIPDDFDRQAAQVDWEFASEVRRSSPLIAALAHAVDLNDGQIDALFDAAAAIQ